MRINFSEQYHKSKSCSKNLCQKLQWNHKSKSCSKNLCQKLQWNHKSKSCSNNLCQKLQWNHKTKSCSKNLCQKLQWNHKTKSCPRTCRKNLQPNPEPIAKTSKYKCLSIQQSSTKLLQVTIFTIFTKKTMYHLLIMIYFCP
jgi:hypothetical protein